MPAFGFKSQFVPLVERGEKTQTIRASRPRNGAYAYSIMQMVSADQIRMPPGAAVTPAT